MPEELVGEVTDFFSRPVVAGIRLSRDVKAGDRLHIKGHTTDLEFLLESMQLINQPVQEAKSGTDIGVKVPDRCRRGDKVYKVV
ncbi:MAG: translation elongation factor-like protein [Dehalococcoidia bacterium]|nr:translation elongation factor-like protein [Dehalococcoidia bacterium]